MWWTKPTRFHQAQWAVLRQARFTPAQIDRLLLYRAAYRDGYYHPDPTAPARLAFARWLHQQRKISG